MIDKDFILFSLGIGTQDDAIEKITESFCIVYYTDDVWEVMQKCNGHYVQFNNLFIRHIYEKIIDKNRSIYLDEGNWDCECDGIRSSLYYNGEAVGCPEDIDKEIAIKKSDVLAYILEQIDPNEILAAHNLMCCTHSTLAECDNALAEKICDVLQEYYLDSDLSWVWMEKITDAYEEVFSDLYDAIIHEQ